MAITWFGTISPFAKEAARLQNQKYTEAVRRGLEERSPLYRLIHNIPDPVPDDIQ